MYDSIVQDIIKQIDDTVLFISLIGSHAYGYNTDKSDLDFCVYTTGEKFYNFKLTDTIDVWVWPISDYILKGYPHHITDWFNINNIIYCIDNNFKINTNDLLINVIPIIARRVPFILQQKEKQRAKIVLKRFYDTGKINYQLSLNDFNKTFSDNFLEILEKKPINYNIDYNFRKQLCKLLIKYGGENNMYTKYTLEALDIVVKLLNNEEPQPITKMATDEEIANSINLITQAFNFDDPRFDHAYDLFGLTNFCPITVIKNLIQIFTVNNGTDKSKENLNQIIAENIPNDIFRYACTNQCIDYIIRMGWIKDYKDYIAENTEFLKNYRKEKIRWNFYRY